MPRALQAAGEGGGEGGGAGRLHPGKPGGGACPPLQDLIDAGIIIPGRNNITVSYKGTTYTASLEKDGSISYQGRTAALVHSHRVQWCPCLNAPVPLISVMVRCVI